MPSTPANSRPLVKRTALRGRKRRKKIRYRQLAFKLTCGQLEALEKLCRNRKTTPIRFLKALINLQIDRYRTETPVSYVTENQLELFDTADFGK